jgi:hypothetical protein
MSGGGLKGVNAGYRSKILAKQAEKKAARALTKSDGLPYEVAINEHTAAGTHWDEGLGLAEVRDMRGNFWRTHGFSMNRKNMLHPEETLYLYETGKLQLYVEGEKVVFHEFYELIINLISLPCYLTYTKLKNLDYIVMRYHRSGAPLSFKNDDEIYGR